MYPAFVGAGGRLGDESSGISCGAIAVPPSVSNVTTTIGPRGVHLAHKVISSLASNIAFVKGVVNA